MEEFVRVRMVQANAMDLTWFQFDYDLTFAAFFMNADGTIYGRFGSRSSQDAMENMSMPGFRLALEGALDLHDNYPANRDALAGKQPVTPRYERPEQYPSRGARLRRRGGAELHALSPDQRGGAEVE